MKSLHTGLLALVASSLPLASSWARADATREWNFAVSLDGRPIGEHRFTLRESGDIREVQSEASFRVRFLFVDAYRYEHRARERWDGDCVQSVDASTDTNGKRQRVSVGAELTTETCIQTFAYWNPSILDARRLLNPQTGEYVDVKILPMGRDVIGGVPVDRFRLLGSGDTPLQIDLWYTASREWVALESLTPEGRRLNYSRK